MTAPKSNWKDIFSDIAKSIQPSPIRRIGNLAKKEGVISFAGGNPDPKIFPVKGFSEAAAILEREGKDLLQYGDTSGYLPLKEFVGKWMASRMGRVTKPEEMLITTGSQQGMELLTATLANPGDTIIVEDPTYPGAIHTMRNRAAHFAPVPCDEDGMRVDLLPQVIERERAAGRKIAFVYSIVNFQNPSGATLSLERRKKMLEIAEKYDLVIFEDDPYGHLRFDGETLPTLFSLDTSGRVVYACSFSKILAPGARVAWIAGAPELIAAMTMFKQGVDICTSVVSQGLVYEYCRLGHLDGFLPKIVAHYKAKRDMMADAFEKYLPAETVYKKPQGGFFFWLKIPGVDTQKLFDKALEKGVAFIPGPAFFSGPGGENELRTCFTFAQEAEIVEGSKRLRQAIEEMK